MGYFDSFRYAERLVAALQKIGYSCSNIDMASTGSCYFGASWERDWDAEKKFDIPDELLDIEFRVADHCSNEQRTARVHNLVEIDPNGVWGYQIRSIIKYLRNALKAAGAELPKKRTSPKKRLIGWYSIYQGREIQLGLGYEGEVKFEGVPNVYWKYESER